MGVEDAQGLRILAEGLPGLAEPLAPDLLASVHPLWAADVAEFGPWTHDPALGWLSQHRLDSAVMVCGACASSMDVARELVGQGGLGPWGSVVAPVQAAGRGQLRREWLSAPGNLMATLVLPAAEGIWNDLRPLVLGHLLAEALEGVCGEVLVKWPNDLLLDGHKIGGILVEERPGCILAGIGLNLVWAPAQCELRGGHGAPASAFPALAQGSGPLRLWLRLVNRLETGYRILLESYSSSDFLWIFQSRLAWIGARVLVNEGAGVRYEAILRGVSGRGELVLDRDGREVLLLAGDVKPV